MSSGSNFDNTSIISGLNTRLSMFLIFTCYVYCNIQELGMVVRRHVTHLRPKISDSAGCLDVVYRSTVIKGILDDT